MIQVIKRVFDILELVASDNSREWRLSEIADTLKLNHATCANIIASMQERGYLEQREKRKGYRLGGKLFDIVGRSYYEAYTLNSTFYIVDELSRDIHETVILSAISDNQRKILHEAYADHEVIVKTKQFLPAYKASTSRVILSRYPEAPLNHFIEEYGLPTEEEWQGITSVQDLKAELAKIAQEDVYFDVNTHHVASLSCPITVGGITVAAIGLYLPDFRLLGNRKSIFSEKLFNAARRIEAQLK